MKTETIDTIIITKYKYDLIGTRLSISGAILMAFNISFLAWIIWIIADSILILHNHEIKEFNQRNMFAVFLFIAFIGVKNTI